MTTIPDLGARIPFHIKKAADAKAEAANQLIQDGKFELATDTMNQALGLYADYFEKSLEAHDRLIDQLSVALDSCKRAQK